MYRLENGDILIVDLWDNDILEDLTATLDQTTDSSGLSYAFVFAERPEGQPATIVTLLWYNSRCL
jgi:hypothetical protein